MKTKIYGQSIIFILLLTGIQLFQPSLLSAQDSTSAEGYKCALTLKQTKNHDGSRTYTSKLEGTGEKGTFPVYQAEISLFNETDGGVKELIGSGKTDKEGNSVITLGKEVKYKKNKQGIIIVKSFFKGTGAIQDAEASVAFTDLDLAMKLEEKDSARIISITASELSANDERLPLKETTANIYIQGLYSKLKIGDCFIDNGEGTFNFPDNIPGDENGSLNIFVRIEENEKFGDVEASGNAKWGQHRSGFTEPSRSLWSSGAPLWMIITLTILLVGVWSHYIFAITQLIKIKKEGNSIES